MHLKWAKNRFNPAVTMKLMTTAVLQLDITLNVTDVDASSYNEVNDYCCIATQCKA